MAENKKIKKCPVSLQPDIENLLQDLTPDDFASASSQEKEDFIQENYESVLAIPYDMPIVGYGNHVVNTLRIWDAEQIVDFHLY